MASSVSSGERRWGSTRRGGMTVLGKVAVPKPVNLPSQRLENHGLDPNVEIVPKGTLSWGSRSSSSAQNAWGSPALSSPNTDGSTGSPSRLNDRPLSSGGSGTRPSTAGSDKSYEPAPNVWGSGSRPSSASGVLVSNKTTAAAARPRSAETRPGSSHLSRFAEPPSENSVAWGASRSMGASSCKNGGFTLSSGDFPTLGSEKNAEADVKNGHSSQERPISASGRVASSRERLEPKEDECSMDETRNSWKRDNSPYVGGPPNADKWCMETHPYPDSIVSPQQFGPWHGPSVHNCPDGVWFRGGPPGGAYRPPGPPGSYHLEPFAYYHPRLPGQPPANMQPVPRAVSGPSGYHSNNGNPYRPHMPDTYMQPVMPIRPGAYPVQMPYEGYYGPPRAGFCNPNDRDAPVLGMGTGPSVYNRHPIQNMHPDSGNIHPRMGGQDHPMDAVMAKEQGEPGQLHGSHPGPLKVLLKQHDSWEESNSKEKEHILDEQHRRGNLPGPSTREVELVTEGNDEPVVLSKVTSEEASSQSSDTWGGHRSATAISCLPESMSSNKVANDNLVRKPEVAVIPGEAPQKNLSTKRSPTLIEKIEGLNNKVRNSDGRHDVGLASFKDEKLKTFGGSNAKSDTVIKSARSIALSAGKTLNATPIHESAGDKKIETFLPVPASESPSDNISSSSECGGTSYSHNQKRPQGFQSRTDYRSKGKLNSQEGDEWRKKPLVTDAPIVSSSKNVDLSSDKHELEHSANEVKHVESDVIVHGRAGGELHAKPTFDPSDHKVQRDKMREIAAQRAKQLQKEEEERTREQKAKARAKLEELNRRTLTENSTEKLDHSLPPSEDALHGQQETQSNAGPSSMESSSAVVPSSSLGSNSNVIGQGSDDNAYKLGESTNLPKELSQATLQSVTQDPVITTKAPLPQESSEENTDHKMAQVHEYNSVVKPRQMSYKRKQHMEKNLHDRPISTGTNMGPKDHGVVSTSTVESKLPSNANNADDQSLQPKKKNNRGSKNRQKEGTSLSSLVPKEESSVKASDDGSNLKSSNSLSDVASTVQEWDSSDNTEGQNSLVVVPIADQGWSMPPEEITTKSKHQLKPQPTRWMPRHSQSSRTEKQHNGDNVVWAPVRTLNKNEASEVPPQNKTTEALSAPVNGSETHSTPKSKRAEMERYVPKPVAKELSQQGNTQPPLCSSVNQVASNENTGKVNSVSVGKEISESDGQASGKGAVSSSKNGESKHNKHGKGHGLWRQRGSVDSVPVGSVEGSSYSSDPGRALQDTIEQRQSTKPDSYLPKEQPKGSEKSSDVSNLMPPKQSSGEVIAKDQGVTGRGKRHASKGHRGIEHNLNSSDLKDLHFGSFGVGDLAPELNQSVGRTISGEDHGAGTHSSSHWQPKSQASVDANQQVTKGNGGQKVAKTSQREHPPQGGRNLTHSHPDGLDAQNNVVFGGPNKHHIDAKSEGKVLDSSKDDVLLPDQHSSKANEPALPDNVNSQHGRSFSSGYRRQGNPNGRFARGQEMSRGNRNTVGQESSKQMRTPANNDRRRHNAQFEYHLARSHSNDTNEPFNESSRARGARYREKGQTHTTHGGSNFHERENSNVQVAVSYNNGE